MEKSEGKYQKSNLDLDATNNNNDKLMSTQTRDLILNMRDKIRLNNQLGPELEAYIPLNATHDITGKIQSDLYSMFQDYLESEKKVLLILGGAGSGKSLFGRFLEKILWESWEEGKPIFLHIKLTTDKDILVKYFKANGFSHTQIDELKSNYEFIIYLDGFDELKTNQNLIVQNNLHEWRAKLVFTCRDEYLRGQEESTISKYFAWPLLEKVENNSPEIVYTLPFDDKQISEYLQKYIENHKSTINWTIEKYLQHINNYNGLRELIKAPLLLRITSEVFPVTAANIEESKSNNMEVNKALLTRNELYSTFVTELIRREATKMISAKDKYLGKNNEVTIKKYCQLIAKLMFERSTIVLTLNDQLSNNNDPQLQKFFEFVAKSQEFIGILYPLLRIDQNICSFIHKSIYEYLVSSEILDDIMGKMSQEDDSSMTPNNVKTTIVGFMATLAQGSMIKSRLLHDEPSIISFLVDAANKDEIFVKKLFSLIDTSKTDKSRGSSIGAANAITILNQSRIPLMGLDFSNVDITSANLDYVILENTNFEGACVEKVSMHGAYIRNSNFKNSKMMGLNLGQNPSFQATAPAFRVAVSPDDSIVAFSAVGVFAFNSKTGKQLFCSGPGKQGIVSAKLAFSPDSRLLAYWGYAEHGLYDFVAQKAINVPTEWPNSWHYDGMFLEAKIIAFRDTENDQDYYSNYDDNQFIFDLSQNKRIKKEELKLSAAGENKMKQLDYIGYNQNLSPDLKFKAHNGDVRRMNTCDLVFKYQGSCPTFSQKSTYFASIDGTICIIRKVSTGAIVIKINSAREHCACWPYQFSNDESIIYVGAGDGLEPHNLNQVAIAFAPKSYNNKVNGLIFLNNEKFLTVDDKNCIYVWKMDHNKGDEIIGHGHETGVSQCQISPNKKYFVTGSTETGCSGIDHKISIWETEDLKLLKTFVAKCDDGAQLYLDNNSYLVQGTRDRISTIHRLSDQKEILDVPAAGNEVYNNWGEILISNDDKYAVPKLPASKESGAEQHFDQPSAEASFISNLKVYEIETGKESTLATQTVLITALSPDNLWLATGSKDGVHIWRIGDWKEIKHFDDDVIPNRLDFYPDGSRLVACYESGSTLIYDMKALSKARELEPHSKPVRRLKISEDQKYIATIGLDDMLHVYDGQIYETLMKKEFNNEMFNYIVFIKFSSSSNWMCISGNGDSSCKVFLYNIATKVEEIILPTLVGSAQIAVFSDDGKTLCVAGSGVQCFKIREQEITLRWTTNFGLVANNADFTGVEGLTFDQKRLLKQHGALI